jgi:hypothetical protein
MRTIYLLIILGLVCFMTYEFNFFIKHYTYLESQLEYINAHCK